MGRVGRNTLDQWKAPIQAPSAPSAPTTTGAGVDYKDLLDQLMSLSSGGGGMGSIAGLAGGWQGFALQQGLGLAGGLLENVFGSKGGQQKKAKRKIGAAEQSLTAQKGKDVFDPNRVNTLLFRGGHGRRKAAAETMQDMSGNVNALDIQGALKESEFDTLDNLFSQNIVANAQMTAQKDLNIDMALLDSAIQQYMATLA